MDSVLQKIVNADAAARENVAKANEKAAQDKQALEQEKQKISEQILEKAEKSIETLNLRETERAKHIIEQTEQNLQQQSEAMDVLTREKMDQWVEHIYSSVVSVEND